MSTFFIIMLFYLIFKKEISCIFRTNNSNSASVVVIFTIRVVVESEKKYTLALPIIFFNMTSWILRTKFVVIYDLPQIVQIRLHPQPDDYSL